MSRIFNKRNRCAIVMTLLLAFSLLCFGSAMASEGSHEGGHEAAAEGAHGGGDRTGDYLDLLARAVNFAALVIILFVVIKKSNAFGFFSNRIDEIKQKMEDLKREKEESEKRYREIEKKLDDFEGEKKAIIAQAKQDGLAEKEKIIAEAKERVQQILEQAERNIQHEMQAAKDLLKREVVDLAAQKAEEIIAGGMNDEDQDRLVDDFIERVGKIH